MDLYHAWIRILRDTVAGIIYCYRLKVPVPNIIVEKMHRWGRWDPLTRTIAVSDRLLRYCSWDAVIETLKHELSHLIVDEVFHASFAMPHGDEFKRASRMIGASERATASDADMGFSLDDRRKIEQQPKEALLIQKVKKLFALSTSPHEKEASSAMLKANELLLKYNLSVQKEGETHSDYDYCCLERKTRRVPVEEVLICNILKDFFFVDYILVPSYQPNLDVRTTSIEIMGRKENLEMAEYVYAFLIRCCDLFWQEYRRKNGLKGIRHKKSYLLGLLEGFRKKMERGRNAPFVSNELVLAVSPLMEEFFKYRHPRVRRSKGGGRWIHSDPYKQGQEDGKSIVLHKPVHHDKKRFKGLILGNKNNLIGHAL
ncbi:MAG: DUF2786 domain-containing protein [Candidatus Aureabacteria bacterium]|nr:DUF2786 domain-containing protein [Candidatus Auribacterota bacterium]